MRTYIVTYVLGNCSCDNCQRQKAVQAASHAEARQVFQAKAPLAWVLSISKEQP